MYKKENKLRNIWYKWCDISRLITTNFCLSYIKENILLQKKLAVFLFFKHILLSFDFAQGTKIRALSEKKKS